MKDSRLLSVVEGEGLKLKGTWKLLLKISGLVEFDHDG